MQGYYASIEGRNSAMNERLMRAVMLLLAAVAPSVGLCADVLTGLVYDLGGNNPKTSGIPGVSVSVRDAHEQALGNGITDARGNYAIEVQGDAKTPLFARYEKVGYFAYPTI